MSTLYNLHFTDGISIYKEAGLTENWGDSFELPETRVELIESLLRDAVIMRKLKPGERVNEAQIAKQLGVSRSPVREAIRKLEKEGLFTVTPQKGTTVTLLTTQDAREIYTVRSLLETYAVCTAIENNLFTEQDIRGIKELLDNIQSFERQKDFYDAVKVDWEFHLAVCRPCHIDLIVEFLKMLQGRIWLCMYTPTLFYSKPGEQSDIHQRIFDAIIQKDAEKARLSLKKHHQDSLQALISKMEEME
jgi:DNA-binding GntR family transcriptional regulator